MYALALLVFLQNHVERVIGSQTTAVDEHNNTAASTRGTVVKNDEYPTSSSSVESSDGQSQYFLPSAPLLFSLENSENTFCNSPLGSSSVTGQLGLPAKHVHDNTAEHAHGNFDTLASVTSESVTPLPKHCYPACQKFV